MQHQPYPTRNRRNFFGSTRGLTDMLDNGGIMRSVRVARHAFRICPVPKPVKYKLASCLKSPATEGAVSNAVTTP